MVVRPENNLGRFKPRTVQNVDLTNQSDDLQRCLSRYGATDSLISTLSVKKKERISGAGNPFNQEGIKTIIQPPGMTLLPLSASNPSS